MGRPARQKPCVRKAKVRVSHVAFEWEGEKKRVPIKRGFRSLLAELETLASELSVQFLILKLTELDTNTQIGALILEEKLSQTTFYLVGDTVFYTIANQFSLDFQTDLKRHIKLLPGPEIELQVKPIPVRSEGCGFNILVKTLTNHPRSIYLPDGEESSVLDIATAIYEWKGISVTRMVLLFESTRLDLSPLCLVKNVGIGPNAVVHVIESLRGGMYVSASGFNDTTGDFLYIYTNLHGVGRVPIHPGWTHEEFVETISSLEDDASPANTLSRKFQQTARRLHKLSLQRKQFEIQRMQEELQRAQDSLKKDCSSDDNSEENQ